MKPGIHPDYHPVVFQDANTGTMFLTRSTLTSSRTIDWETPTGVQTYRRLEPASLDAVGPLKQIGSTTPQRAPR
ncbi:50S ribosomal protein L31 type B [Mycobacterium simulans]|nr:50S ribosomal protein L31 type B [Mycobacterium simulans]